MQDFDAAEVVVDLGDGWVYRSPGGLRHEIEILRALWNEEPGPHVWQLRTPDGTPLAQMDRVTGLDDDICRTTYASGQVEWHRCLRKGDSVTPKEKQRIEYFELRIRLQKDHIAHLFDRIKELQDELANYRRAVASVKWLWYQTETEAGEK